jgi:hypothetical protein
MTHVHSTSTRMCFWACRRTRPRALTRPSARRYRSDGQKGLGSKAVAYEISAPRDRNRKP